MSLAKIEDANLSADLDTNIQAGIGNRSLKNEIQAQGDVIQVTNDTRLMNFIIYTLGGLCMALITGLIAIAKKLITTSNEKKDYKDRFIARCINSDKELDELRIDHEKNKKKKKRGTKNDNK